ncbi:MAG: hypothetical protein HYY06_09715 [Deltaproteobacteria bacterium]|nr:hypothetical protein [Deltaproteobacteria bacterium]
MSDQRSTLPRLVIIDSRSPSEPPLRPILDRARVHHDVSLATSLEAAAETIAATSPVAVLMHAGFDVAPGAPGAGPLFATLAVRRDPDLPFMLFTGAPFAVAHEAARLGLRLPVVSDLRLADSFEPILDALLTHGAATAALRRATRDAPDEPDAALPEGFLIEQWLGQVERALLLACLREHQHDNLTKAAAAVSMPLSTFWAHVQQHVIEVPNRDGPFFDMADTLLWCSSSPAPSWVCDACDASRVIPKSVAPGTLHSATMTSTMMLAAVVDPIDVGSAVDAWLVRGSVRPFAVVGSAPTPVRFLLEDLDLGRRTPGTTEIARNLLVAGRATVPLYDDVSPDIRRAFTPNGRPAWPMDLPGLLRRLDARILLFAAQTIRSIAAAARAVGLAESTYRARLAKARRSA